MAIWRNSIHSVTGINSDERRCSKCGGTEGIKRSVTSKYISKVVKEVKQRIRGFRKNLPSYLKFMDWFAADIRNDPDMRELFQKYFNKYESEASNSLFHRVEHYFMAHYDASKNSKRTWCSLSNNYIYAIEIDDPNYKKLIKDLLDSYEIHDDIKCEGLIIELRQKLGELNYPNDMIFQKIGMDGELMHILQPTSDISSNS